MLTFIRDNVVDEMYYYPTPRKQEEAFVEAVNPEEALRFDIEDIIEDGYYKFEDGSSVCMCLALEGELENV